MKIKNLDINFFKLSILILNFLSILLLCFYVFLVNKTVTKGYEISKFQKERNEIVAKQESINLEISKLESMSFIENDPYIANMLPEGDIGYVYENINVAKK